MSEHLFSVDPSRLHLVVRADATGFLGTLDTPAQACRAAFLAAQVGAINWDGSRWSDLEFGIWFDEPPEAVTAGTSRHHRTAEPVPTAQLSTWLQLHPSWPQLGGPGIPWPPPNCPAGPDGFGARLATVTSAAVAALNTTHHRTMQMAQTLVTPAVPAIESTAPMGGSLRRTFTAAGIATTENQVADVLARLAADAESHAVRHRNGHPSAVTHLDHQVTAVPGPDKNGRYLVTLTATAS